MVFSHSFLETYFGPVDPRMCNYFFYMSLISAIASIISAGLFIKLLIKPIPGKKTKDAIINMAFFSLNSGFFYFSNRIFYNMCKASSGHAI
jgi:hypothetical protein